MSSTLDPTPAPTTALAEQRLAGLSELAELGMRIARVLTVQVEEAAAGAEPGRLREVELAFTRVARAVRQTFALQQRMEAGVIEEARQVQAARQAQSERGDAERLRTREARLFAAREAVEQLIEDADPDEEEVERLMSGLYRCMDRAKTSGIAERPVEEIILAICRDLGIAPPPGLLDWALAQAAVGASAEFAQAP